MEFLIVLALLVVVVLVVTAPLRRERAPDPERDSAAEAAEGVARELAELEAARDAKFREIRDAELDRDTGKLSEEDFARLDRELRSDAIDLLREIDRISGVRPDPSAEVPPAGASGPH